jgi:flagellar motor switch/type III secretory pathway protein FliN
LSTAIERTEGRGELGEAADELPPRRPAEVLPWLPCTLALDVPVVHFSVRNLLELAAGVVLETSCHQSMDIPLRVNGLLLAWTEFEVVGERLAARITDLA